MFLATAWTQATWSGGKCTNHEAAVPPLMQAVPEFKSVSVIILLGSYMKQPRKTKEQYWLFKRSWKL